MQTDQTAINFRIPGSTMLLGALLCYGLVCILVANNDQAMFMAINGASSLLPEAFWTNLSLLGNGWGAYALLFPVLLAAQRLLIASLMTGPFAGILSRFIKNIANMPRPPAVLDASQIHVIGNPLYHSSMPSGHAITAFAVATALYITLWNIKHRRYYWLFALAAGICLSRIAVGAHWPSDVMIGAAVGVVCGAAGARIAAKIPQSNLAAGRWPSWVLATLGLACALVLINSDLDFPQNRPTQYLLAAGVVTTLLHFVRQCRGGNVIVGRALEPEA